MLRTVIKKLFNSRCYVEKHLFSFLKVKLANIFIFIVNKKGWRNRIEDLNALHVGILEAVLLNSFQRLLLSVILYYNTHDQWWHGLLLWCFVFLIVKASAKREWPVINRKGPWEGHRRLSPSRLPLRAHFHRERDVWVRGRWWHIFVCH